MTTMTVTENSPLSRAIHQNVATDEILKILTKYNLTHSDSITVLEVTKILIMKQIMGG